RDVLEAAGRAALAAEQAEGALDAARAAWTPASGGREGTALLARELRDEAAAARALLPEVDRAAAMRRDISRLGRRIETLDAACAQASRTAATWPERLAAQERVVSDAQTAAVRLPAELVAVQAAETALEAARAAELLVATLVS